MSEEIKPYLCPVCEERFSTKYDMELHWEEFKECKRLAKRFMKLAKKGFHLKPLKRE
jgi:hypothetical protein